jgi:trimeric autotransporter adhesin
LRDTRALLTETANINKHQKPMKQLIQFKQACPAARRSGILMTFVLAGFALLQQAQAVVPAPDGGYPGGNTAEGQAALFGLTTGTYNTAVGFFSLLSNTEANFNTGVGAGTLLLNTGEENTATGAGTLLSNTTGGDNTANGAFALFSNTEGTFNTASGAFALFSNTTGTQNTANGYQALLSNTEANGNTATGHQALRNNSTGVNNTANGTFALGLNTTGDLNTAAGYAALASNNIGSHNTATGVNALFSNATGGDNTANGTGALFSNTTGSVNTATGAFALVVNTEGNSNTANGYFALHSNTTGGNNVAFGNSALQNNITGVNNTALGFSAGSNATTSSNNVYIGANMVGVADESDACYIASIFGQTSVDGLPVLVNANNKLGTTTSSKRFKEDIQPMDKTSEALLALRPVTFRYKKEIDPAGRSQFGLVAEEVEKVNPDLVVHDKDRKIYSVRYDQVNAMLLNEFLKEHKKVEEQQATIAQLTKQMETLVAHAREQDSKIEKVSGQLEVNKFAVEDLSRDSPAFLTERNPH